jgi:hypothetical protein
VHCYFGSSEPYGLYCNMICHFTVGCAAAEEAGCVGPEESGAGHSVCQQLQLLQMTRHYSGCCLLTHEH